MIINAKTLVACISLSVFSASIQAKTRQTDIELTLTHTEYVKLTGTAPGSSRQYDNNDIANWIFPSVVDLGTMGLESNVGGNCDLNFSTLNNFELLHTVSGNSLTKYKVLYQNQEFGRTSNPTLTIPCTTLPTNIQFTPTQVVFGNIFPALFIQSGNYRDVITVVVTTQ